MVRGVFGGSFDPVHVGHTTVARAAAGALGLGRVHLIPAREQPFKQGLHGATPEHRVAMLHLAVGDDPVLIVDPREIDRPGPSYTVDTLRELHATFPDDALCLLVGADAAADLPAWRDVAAVCTLARVVVMTRPGAAHGSAGLGEDLVVPPVEVSASEVRDRVRKGESVEGLVAPAVAAYIREHGLYESGD
jgi:nicotinate-nucleotide adenylyltransferase